MKTLTTYGIRALRKEAGDSNLNWSSILLDVVSQLPNNPIPGPITDVIDVLLKDLQVSRDYWEAFFGSGLSVKVGRMFAIDEYSNSQKLKKLIAAQAVLISPELELAESSLNYDVIRHNYSWKGTLIELQDSFKASTKPNFCVVHPDDQFQPISIIGSVHVVRSCSQKNPDYANLLSRPVISYQQRMRILEARRRALAKT